MSLEQVRLAPTGHLWLFTHAVLWGAGAVAAAAGGRVTLGWTAGLQPAPVLHGVDEVRLAALVHASAVRATDHRHWIQAALPHEPGRALFSPRLRAFSANAWPAWQAARDSHVDQMVAAGAALDLRLVAGLGEPSSWHEDRGEPRQDHAASRLELQPRNQGSEFVGTRLRALAAATSRRSLGEVAAGLTGQLVRDEASDSADSRSAANLRPPGRTDNALAWLAMWGLAALPVQHRVGEPSRTPPHLPRGRQDGLGDEVRAGHVVVPLWAGRWTGARLRSVLTSAALSAIGAEARSGPSTGLRREQQWLTERGVTGIVLMPMHTFGSTSSPERRVMGGEAVRLGQ